MRAVEWLSRIGKSRGFGVQSPSDYRFVRHVVNEKWPYHPYEDLRKAVAVGSKRERKLCELYFRIANFVQPDVCVDIAAHNTSYARYMKDGCRKTQVVAVDRTASVADFMSLIDDTGTIGLLRATFFHGCRELLEAAMSRTDSRTVFILEGIMDSREARNTWRWLVEDARTGVTFDLYRCGIAFFDTLRSKQNYKINF